MHALLLIVAGVNLLSTTTFDNGTVAHALEDSRAVPVAIITYTTINGGSTVEDGETVLFDGTSSYDPDGGSIVKYRWRVNGSLQGTASTFSWTFDINDGTTQTIKLSIWDDENEYKEITEALTVIAGNQPPVASFTPAGHTVDDDETVNFTSTSTDPDGTISSEEWFVNSLGGTPDGTGGTFDWTFDIAAGTTQTIYLVATDDDSASDTTSEVFTIQEAGAQTITRHYYLKDHLGSTRMTVNDSSEVVHYTDYYPFGMLLPGRSMMSSTDAPKELYTGHQLDDETGLYYAGARYYDPMIARWGSEDPLADDYPGWSPYNYVVNSPLRFIDPNGLWIQRVDEDGNVTFEAEEGDNFQTFMDQYGLSEEAATEWFNTHGLSDYLPAEKGGLLGFLGFKSYSTVEAGRSFVSQMGFLKADVHALSKQQVADQLAFALDFSIQSGAEYLNLSNYFSGIGPGNSGTHVRIKSSAGVTFSVGDERVPVGYLEMPILAWYNDIGLIPQPEQRTIYRGGKPVSVTNMVYYYYGGASAQIVPPTMTIQVGSGPSTRTFLHRYGGR